MGRYERHQSDPLERFAWMTRKRMQGGELDEDLGRLLLSLADDLAEEVGASAMARASAARFMDLYARLESGAEESLLTHSRGVSQLVALERAIRAGGKVKRPAGPRGPMWQRSGEGDDNAA